MNQKFRRKPVSKFVLLRRVVTVAFFLATTFIAGYSFGRSERASVFANFPSVVNIRGDNPEGREKLDFAMFWRVWDTLEKEYFDPGQIVEAKLVYGAIQGMVAAVGDPYTVFLPPTDNKISTEDLSGSFEGVGIQIGFRGQQLAVISPLPESPAEEAGILAGDFIVGITDVQKEIDRGTVGISLPDAVTAIRGPAGSQVSLTLIRDGVEEAIVAEVTRRSIDVPSIALEFVGEGESIAHLRILRFGEETLDEWDKYVLEILKKPGLQGIVVDLRNNPGGFLARSVDLAADFMEIDSIVTIEEWGDGRREEFRTDRMGRLINQRTVVLINGGSASASEILAGAMRDNSGILLVGTKSFGKGTIQEAMQLEGGSGLHLTVAKWLTPSEYWVNDGGLEPDIEVEDDLETVEDEQLDRAIEEVTN